MSATGRRSCSRPRGSVTTRSPPRWGWPRAPSGRRSPGLGDDWSRPIARRNEGSMPHLDEGTLHALLDGELEGTEVMEIQAHLGSCTSCGSRLKDIREFMAEADRLLGSVDLSNSPSRSAPASVVGPAPEAPRPAREAPARAAAPKRPLPPPDRAPPWEEPPVLLIPDNPDTIELRRRWLHGMGWAAIVAVAVGLGFIVSQARNGAAPIAAGP